MDFYHRLYLTYRKEDQKTVRKILAEHYRRGNIEGIWGTYDADSDGFMTTKMTCYLVEDFIAIQNELKNNGVVLR